MAPPRTDFFFFKKNWRFSLGKKCSVVNRLTIGFLSDHIKFGGYVDLE